MEPKIASNLVHKPLAPSLNRFSNKNSNFGKGGNERSHGVPVINT